MSENHDIPTEAETWLEHAPKQPNGKVSIFVVIAEGQRRGYCICPKPLRQLIVFDGWTCSWCHQPETADSHRFWYGEAPPKAGSRVIICPRCYSVSANTNDIREGFCGHCHDWTSPRPAVARRPGE